MATFRRSASSIGYNKSNMSALLKRFLSRVDEVVARVSQKGRR
jgi:hypothetical protein